MTEVLYIFKGGKFLTGLTELSALVLLVWQVSILRSII